MSELPNMTPLSAHPNLMLLDDQPDRVAVLMDLSDDLLDLDGDRAMVWAEAQDGASTTQEALINYVGAADNVFMHLDEQGVIKVAPEASYEVIVDGDSAHQIRSAKYVAGETFLSDNHEIQDRLDRPRFFFGEASEEALNALAEQAINVIDFYEAIREEGGAYIEGLHYASNYVFGSEDDEAPRLYEVKRQPVVAWHDVHTGGNDITTQIQNSHHFLADVVIVAQNMGIELALEARAA